MKKIQLKRIVLFIFLLGISLAKVIAQDEDKDAKFAKLQEAKHNLIKSRLSLTNEQSQSFWPLYKEYSTKKTTTRKNIRQLKKEGFGLTKTDAELLSGMKQILTLRQQEVDLEKEYIDKFLKVITTRQLAELYKAESDFMKMVLKRLEE